jgi:hypothetical protein
MRELLVEKFIGVHTADAEGVELRFQAGRLHLAYSDWQERRRDAHFTDVLAFRWQEQIEEAMPRDDTSYEVIDSNWLRSHADIQTPGVRYAHYKLCFNACGVLDVLCQAIGSDEPPGQSRDGCGGP